MNQNHRFPQLHRDAPPVPPGLAPRSGVIYGCGAADCTSCYEPAPAGASRPYAWAGGDGDEPNSTQLRTLILAVDAMMQTTLTDNPNQTVAQAHRELARQVTDMASFVDAALFASGDILFLRATK